MVSNMGQSIAIHIAWLLYVMFFSEMFFFVRSTCHQTKSVLNNYIVERLWSVILKITETQQKLLTLSVNMRTQL